MLLDIFPIIHPLLEDIKSDKSITGNGYKALIYFYFIHSTIEGRHIFSYEENRATDNADQEEAYVNEKLILRKIALQKQVYKETLTEKRLKRRIDFSLEQRLTSQISKIRLKQY
jgi:hypothetical protein